jgi:hypothetical protein
MPLFNPELTGYQRPSGPSLKVSSPVDTFMQATAPAEMQAALGPISSPPALSSYTYSASPAAGCFTANQSSPSNTNSIGLPDYIFGGDTITVAVGCFIMFTNSAGVTSVFNVASITGAGLTFGLEYQATIGGNDSAWGGLYQISFAPGSNAPALSAVLSAASITPIADGTYTLSNSLGGSITLQSGVVTGFSTAN